MLIYSAKNFEIPFLKAANRQNHQVVFTSERLTSKTAQIAIGFEIVSIFSADDASPLVLEKLKDFGVRYITLRSAGHDNINIKVAKKLKLKVANAPGYSPNAISEHAIALLLALNRKICTAVGQVKRRNFTLDALVGFDVQGKTAGVIGTGKIGSVLVKLLSGFECDILANDLVKSTALEAAYKVRYKSLETLCKEADLIFLCLPLTSETHYLIDKKLLALMKPEVVLINVARGAIVNTREVLQALDLGKIGGYATDVYEKESGIFFYDHSDAEIKDTLLLELLQHPKTIVTPHQAFVTKEALTNIAKTTFYNIDAWNKQKTPVTSLTE